MYDDLDPPTLSDSLDKAGLKAFAAGQHVLRSDFRISIACRGLPKKEGIEVIPGVRKYDIFLALLC